MKKRLAIQIVLVASIVIGVACAGCEKKQQASEEDGDIQEKTPVSFLISADTAGWIEPCGCTTKQSGGLPRRGTMVKSMREKQTTVVLDCGGAAAGVSDYHQLKLESIMAGEAAMGLVAHNVGGSEAAFGGQTLQQLVDQQIVPLFSTNVCDASGKPIGDQVQWVSAGGNRIAVLGVMDPKFKGDQLQVLPPQQAILNAIEAFVEKPDAIIVLAYLPRPALMKLAKLLPEVDVIVGGPTGQTISPTRVGAVLVTSSTNKGKFLVQLDYDPDRGQRFEAKVVELDESWTDDVDQRKNLDAYHERLAGKDFESPFTGVKKSVATAMDSKDQFVGNAKCQACHVGDCQHYTSTKHSVAWETLENKFSHVDPYCQQCHTTGYGSEVGFVSIQKSPDLFDVGCESCHGPSSRHCEKPTIKTVYDARDQCLQCHDRENSPLFKYELYWPKILHGQQKVAEVSK